MTARKSTSNKLLFRRNADSDSSDISSTARKPVRNDNDFHCTECNTSFATAQQIYEHTKDKHLLRFEEDDCYNEDKDQDNHKSSEEESADELENLNAINCEYYYFCLQCEAEKGILDLLIFIAKLYKTRFHPSFTKILMYFRSFM